MPSAHPPLAVPLDRLIHRSAALETREEARFAVAQGRIAVCYHGHEPVRATRNLQLDPATASILLDGSPLPTPPPNVYIALHKPHSVLVSCAAADMSSRRQRLGLAMPSVLDCLTASQIAGALTPEVSFAGVSPVGRLDADSEGLLLLTNDGTLSFGLLQQGTCTKHYLAALSPRRGIQTADPSSFHAAARAFESGVRLGASSQIGRAEHCNLLSRRAELQCAGAELFAGFENGMAVQALLVADVGMRQGARREIRRSFKALGYETRRLCRYGIGPLRIADLNLKQGEWCLLDRSHVKALYEAVACTVRGMPMYDSHCKRWIFAEQYAPYQANSEDARERRKTELS